MSDIGDIGSDLSEVFRLIRTVPDFPKKGILFRDITPILHNSAGFQAALRLHRHMVRDLAIDRICGIESRGFLFGAPLAQALEVGFFPARKPGKLPAATLEAKYDLEYGSDRIQIHRDAVVPGDRVLVVDDLLASGGTSKAVTQLVESAGGIVVGILVLIELVELRGRDRLDGRRVDSVYKF